MMVALLAAVAARTSVFDSKVSEFQAPALRQLPPLGRLRSARSLACSAGSGHGENRLYHNDGALDLWVSSYVTSSDLVAARTSGWNIRLSLPTSTARRRQGGFRNVPPSMA